MLRQLIYIPCSPCICNKLRHMSRKFFLLMLFHFCQNSKSKTHKVSKNEKKIYILCDSSLYKCYQSIREGCKKREGKFGLLSRGGGVGIQIPNLFSECIFFNKSAKSIYGPQNMIYTWYVISKAFRTALKVDQDSRILRKRSKFIWFKIRFGHKRCISNFSRFFCTFPFVITIPIFSL